MFFYKIIIDGGVIGIHAGADPVSDNAYIQITQEEFDALRNKMEAAQNE